MKLSKFRVMSDEEPRTPSLENPRVTMHPENMADPGRRHVRSKTKSFLQVLKSKNGSKYLVGLFSLAFVILGWAATSFLIEVP